MTEQPPPAAAPGWYPHPTMAGTQAYWDGQQWTDHVAPASPAPVKGDATNAAAKVFLLVAAVVAVIVMGLIADAIVKSVG